MRGVQGVATRLHVLISMLAAFNIPLSWGELLKRTVKETNDDDCLGLAAQLAYYFFLALFPGVLFVLALASFFPLTNLIDDVVRTLRPIAPPDVLAFLEEQLLRISNSDNGGIMTIGFLGAVWSSSAAVTAIVSSLNRAYDIEEGRPWWKVRLTAIGLTVALAVMVLSSFTLIVIGPTLAERVAASIGLGPVFVWTWTILQWPVAFLLVSTALGLVYYFAPDAEQDWVWITPGALIGTLLWVVVSVAFKFYVANFGNYNETYGAVGGVIILLLWFYLSGLAVLVGAEMNAEIEHASPHGKNPGEKVPGEKKKIGAAAARAYEARQQRERAETPSAAPAAAVAAQAERLPNKDDWSLGQLFADLFQHARVLIQQEVHLLKTELRSTAAALAKTATLLTAASVLVFAGVLAVTAAVVMGLTMLRVAPWVGALLTAMLLAGTSYLLIRSALAAIRRQTLTPTATLESLKEDAHRLKTQLR